MERIATVTRSTNETDIAITLYLDGTGKADLSTGIGFFGHMLDGFARHGLFDVSVTCRGDLDIDCHHTIEDVGIALGTAIKEALGDKAGLVRYGSCMLPMDETLALCAVAVGVSVTACMVRPQVEAAHTAPEPPAATAETAAPTPTPAPPETPAAMPAAALPTLNDAANSPRFACPVQYKYISRFMSKDSGHRGDDLHAAEGTEIYDAADGVILTAQEHYS